MSKSVWSCNGVNHGKITIRPDTSGHIIVKLQVQVQTSGQIIETLRASVSGLISSGLFVLI